MKNPKKRYVIENGIARGTLPIGLKVGETVHRDFEMREYDVGDLIDAEGEARAADVFSFAAALLTRQLTRVGSFDGPFTVGQLRKLKAADWATLRAAQQELEASGEPGLGDGNDSSMESP
ncbi:hypothetical protein DLREEDagrD3_29010 [Denitratisoma sp. agr-D3]